MSSLLDFLENLKSEVVLNNFSYIFYDKKDGTIAKISSKRLNEPDLEMLQVPHETVVDILAGTKKMQDFVVTYDVAAKQFLPKEVTYENDLNTVEYKLYQLPVIRTSASLLQDDTTSFFSHIYDGIDVVIYDENEFFYKKQIVWYKNNVYRLKNDIKPGDNLKKNSEIYIYDVKLVDVESDHKIIKRNKTFVLQFEGIKVDVWYYELDHLTGQHVWFENAVYRSRKNVKKNTKFNKKNFELIVDNVKLYEDNNINLTFEKNILIGDLILQNNYLYSVDCKLNNSLVENVCVYFINESKYIFYSKDTKEFFKISIEDEKTNEIELIKNNYEIFNSFVLRNKDKVLIGNKLYQVQTLESRGVDIVVAQNNKTQSWQIVLNKTVRKKLKDTTFNNDSIYFSITAKHDPNILYRYISIKIKDLLINDYLNFPYQYEWEFQDREVSIYTPKYFDTYVHEIVK